MVLRINWLGSRWKKMMDSKIYMNRYRYHPNQNIDDERTVAKISFSTKILLFLALSLIFRITLLIRKRSDDDFAVIDSMAMLEIVIVGLIVAILLLSPYLTTIVSRISKSSASILFIYSIISIFSALWSPLPSYSLFRAVQIVSQLLVIFVVLYEFGSFSSAENFVLKVSTLLMIINLLGQFKLVGYQISLPLLHSNTYSNSAAMIFCYCFHEYFISTREDKKKYRNYALIGLFGIIIGTSATSNIAVLFSLLFTRFIFYKRLSIGMLISSLIIIVSMLSFSKNILNSKMSDIVLAGKNPEAVSTLSGRMHIWTTYMDVAKERPILGHGFAIATRVGTFRVNTAHNVLLAIALDLGLVGLCLFLWGAQRLARECIRPEPQPTKGRLGVLSVFIAALIACQSTPFIATPWHAPNAVFALFLALHTLYLCSPAPAALSASLPGWPPHQRLVRDVRSRRFSQPLIKS